MFYFKFEPLTFCVPNLVLNLGGAIKKASLCQDMGDGNLLIAPL